MLAFLFCCSVYSAWLRVEQLLLSRGNSRLWIYTHCNFLNENKIRGLKWLRAIKLNTVMYLIGQKVTISKSNSNVYFHWIVLRLQVISIFWPKTSSNRFTSTRYEWVGEEMNRSSCTWTGVSGLHPKLCLTRADRVLRTRYWPLTRPCVFHTIQRFPRQLVLPYLFIILDSSDYLFPKEKRCSVNNAWRLNDSHKK